MPAALSIRDDISAQELRRTARLEANGRVDCRLLAIANALDAHEPGTGCRVQIPIDAGQ